MATITSQSIPTGRLSHVDSKLTQAVTQLIQAKRNLTFEISGKLNFTSIVGSFCVDNFDGEFERRTLKDQHNATLFSKCLTVRQEVLYNKK